MKKKNKNRELISSGRKNAVIAPADIDFEGVLDGAVALFGEQAALMTKPAETITIKEIQLSKAKSENFLASIAGMIEISHTVEVLRAEKDKFKRKDELRLLNRLFKQYDRISTFSEKALDLSMDQLEALDEDFAEEGLTEEGLQRMGMLHGYMENSVNTLNSLARGISGLIKTERSSGARGNELLRGGTSMNSLMINLGDNSSKGNGNGAAGEEEESGVLKKFTREELLQEFDAEVKEID